MKIISDNKNHVIASHAKRGEAISLLGVCFVVRHCFIGGLLAMTCCAGCGKSEPIKKQEAPSAIPVKIIKVQMKDINETLEYIGNIKASDEAVVYPKVSGKIIEKIKKDGEAVNKGEAIAYIDRDEVGLKFEKAPVESPLSGTLGKTYVDIGTNVNTQTPIALVLNMDSVKIALDLPEKYLPKVSLNQQATVKVDAYPDDDFKGVITKITPVVDIATRTAPIEIIIANAGHKLKTGMFANVILVLEQHKAAPVILKEALMGRETEIYVYVVEQGKAALRKVQLGIRQGPYVQVTGGLKENDKVVVMGQQRLTDGAQVKAEE